MYEFEKLTIPIIKSFGSELVAVLAYGSRINNPNAVDAFSDYDITVVFSDYPNNHLPDLPIYADVTMVFLSEIELTGVEHFRLDGHGAYYLYVLAHAVALYGSNPFCNFAAQLGTDCVNISLREQIVAYCYKLQRIVIQPQTNEKWRNVRKYSLRIAQNYYFLVNEVCCEKFFNLSYDQWVTELCKVPMLGEKFALYLTKSAQYPEQLEIKEVLEYAAVLKAKVAIKDG
ncbi:hypothetical protein [Microcoleus sp. herbarium12]|uniref:hypothetical protein n=1 Tax=Microcoleus sp. herbarium12 TaxID=3055437 RepID=UPI002FD73331